MGATLGPAACAPARAGSCPLPLAEVATAVSVAAAATAHTTVMPNTRFLRLDMNDCPPDSRMRMGLIAAASAYSLGASLKDSERHVNGTYAFSLPRISAYATNFALHGQL